LSAEVILLDGIIAVYKLVSDVYIVVLGSDRENELIIASVLSAVEESLQKLVRGSIDKRSLIEQLDLLVLSVDEIIDDGFVFLHVSF
jgi:hypothetical protein